VEAEKWARRVPRIRVTQLLTGPRLEGLTQVCPVVTVFVRLGWCLWWQDLVPTMDNKERRWRGGGSSPGLPDWALESVVHLRGGVCGHGG